MHKGEEGDKEGPKWQEGVGEGPRWCVQGKGGL